MGEKKGRGSQAAGRWILPLVLVAASSWADDPPTITLKTDNHVDTVVSTGPVNVSVADGDFNDDEHGGRITKTFLDHSDRARLIQIGGWAEYVGGGRTLGGIPMTDMIRHALLRDGGIVWTSTDDSPGYWEGTKSQWEVIDGRPYHKAPMTVAAWFAHKNTLFISSLENATGSGDGHPYTPLYCDEEAGSDFASEPSATASDGWIPLCGSIDDYIAHTDVAIDRVLFAGAINGVHAQAAVKAGGVFEANAIYVDSPGGSTSHATAVLAAFATNLLADNPSWSATRLRSELLALASEQTMLHYHGATTARGTLIYGTRTIKTLRRKFTGTATISPTAVTVEAGSSSTYTVVLAEPVNDFDTGGFWIW